MFSKTGKCPVCEGTVIRIPRNLYNKIITLVLQPFVQVRLYKCPKCEWKGLCVKEKIPLAKY